jgi:hypothetical protein
MYEMLISVKTQLVTCFHCLYSSFLSEIVGEICKKFNWNLGKSQGIYFGQVLDNPVNSLCAKCEFYSQLDTTVSPNVSIMVLEVTKNHQNKFRNPVLKSS